MRTLAIIGLAAALLLAGAVYLADRQLPALARTQAVDVLGAAGFGSIILPEPQLRLGAVRYDGITLDPHKISTISRLEIHYSPVNLLLRGGLQSISIDGLSLTGEIDADGRLSLAGWHKPPTLEAFKKYPFKTLSIKNGSVSFLTEKFGGLSFAYDLQARRRKQDVEIEATATTGQKHLSFDSTISAAINPQSYWQAAVNINEGKFDIPPIRATRVNGTVKFAGTSMNIQSILSDLNAGGVSFFGFPWKDATGTLEKDGLSTRIYADAKSIGAEGLELSVTFENADGQHTIINSVHADSLSSFFTYLQNLELLSLSEKTFRSLDSVRDVGVDLSTALPWPPGQKILEYTVTKSGRPIPVGGTLQIDTNDDVTGILTGQPIFLSDFESVLGGTERQSLPGFDGGHVTLSGNFEKKKETPLSGWIKMDIADGDFNFGGLNLSAITGPVLIDDLPQLSSTKTQSLSCRLPLAKKIASRCNLAVKVEDGTIKIEKLDAGVFAGHVRAENYTLGPIIVLTADNIDLWELTSALGLKGLTATGKAKATLPLALENGQLVVRDGIITASGEGVVRYIYDKPPAFFKGDEFEQEALKQALQNYHYKSLSLRVNGNLVTGADFTITGRGSNPESFESRPVEIRLQAKAPLAPLLRNIAASPE